MMRHRWQTWIFLTCVLSTWIAPTLASAQCAPGVDAVSALADARQARGVVSDLDLMRAWHEELTRDVEETNAEAGTIFDSEELGYRHSASWLWWSDSFDGYSLCDSATPVDLDRKWWGAEARFDDLKTGLGYELFFLTAHDKLGFSGDLEDIDYGWRHRIAGAELRYRDWASVRVGTIDIEAPARTGEGVHDGSAYLALAVPKFGIGADLLVHPGTRRVNMLLLGVRRTPIPIAGMTLSANGGWLDDEQKGLAGIGLTAFDDALSFQMVVEGAPVRMRSVTMRVDSIHERFWGDDVWLKVGFAPFLEVSAYNGGAFEQQTGRSLVPGAATGCRAFFSLGPLSTGFEAFVGVNRASELTRLTSVVDHVQWGGRIYLRLGS